MFCSHKLGVIIEASWSIFLLPLEMVLLCSCMWLLQTEEHSKYASLSSFVLRVLSNPVQCIARNTVYYVHCNPHILCALSRLIVIKQEKSTGNREFRAKGNPLSNFPYRGFRNGNLI
jgi:glycerol-3-phosphate acyltransferase PlsY